MNHDEMCTDAPAIDETIEEAINQDTLIVPVTPAGMNWYRNELARAEAEIANAQAESATLKTENANLQQENVELHELIGAQRAEIEQLQSSNRKLKLRLINIAGCLRLMVAVYFDNPKSGQSSGQSSSN
jgi:predicted RNase H-like nuclease (RuvC/YqgF family)